jgi:hypothetical protein
VPVSTVTCLQQERLIIPGDPAVAAVADLCTIAFYFLLRVGEYTISSPGKRRRTVQFRVRDVTFWKEKSILPNTSPLEALLQAGGVTLTIDNQKNGVRGSALFHCAINNVTCPIKALSRHVADALKVTGNQETPLYQMPSTRTPSITQDHITKAVRRAITRLGLKHKGFTSTNTGSHSLRAGGAMALKLNGADMATIMKQGRWTSLTFLTYIHNHISHLSASNSLMMSNPIPFFNLLSV